MNPIALLRKLFLGGTWYVGLRDMNASGKLFYQEVETPEGQWIADPFLYEVEDRHYLFVEQYFTDKQRAGIGCYEIINGKAVNNRIIIDKPYHMSYPCVFNYKGKHYMIPETSANNTVDIYVADKFPDEWHLLKNLMTGEKYVDSTVYIKGNDYYVLTYKKCTEGWKLVVFKLDMDCLTLELSSERIYKQNVGRPGGFLFQEGNIIKRPAQDCSKKYGESLILYNVKTNFDEPYSEEIDSKITKQEIQFSQPFDRIHTLNRDSKYEVIDVFKEKFDLFHAFKIYRRAYIKH